MRGEVLLLALLLVGALACAPRGEPSGDAEMPPLLTSVQATTVGDSVHFQLQVTNTTERPIELEFSSGQEFDFVVLDDGREIWRWSADRMFTQALQSETLAPGETVSYEATWVPPPGLEGELTVVGELTARNQDVEQRTRFRI